LSRAVKQEEIQMRNLSNTLLSSLFALTISTTLFSVVLG